MGLFRYTQLFRRNFLRFGKRTGGDAKKIPVEEGTEEMEETNISRCARDTIITVVQSQRFSSFWINIFGLS